MSRGIKDLRELICVSRLTYRDSDEELDLSDDEGRSSRLSMMGQRLEVLSIDSDSPNSSSVSHDATEPNTPDSGIGTNGHCMGDVNIPSLRLDERPKSAKKKKKNKKKHAAPLPSLVTLHELPKPPPLPPVSSGRPSSSSSENTPSSTPGPDGPPGLRRIGGDRGPRVGLPTRSHTINYDQVLSYLEPSVVGEWLEIAHTNVQKLAQWIHTKDNFVQFAHFWLNNFSDFRKQEIFQLEHSILLDHLEYGFAQGRQSAKVKHKDLVEFLSAIFREYPAHVMSAKGPHMFLDYLDILTSERTKAYKALLSDVKCSTRNRQFAQLVLACRCFALTSVWTAVVTFYKRLVGDDKSNEQSLPDMSKLRTNNQRMYLAVRHGYLDVVHYLLLSSKIRTTFKDPSNRTLLFTAVMHNQPKILHFLLYNVRPVPDVNQAAETGNSPLHAAAHCGYAEIAELLLSAPNIEKNPRNADMDGATPLHLAVLQGNVKVVEVLLAAKVDTSVTMGGLTAEEIAKDFGQDAIYELLTKHKETKETEETSS